MIEVDVGGRPLMVAGTHLSHLSQGSPVQFARLRRALSRTSGPAVLAGDMNLWAPTVAAVFREWRLAVWGRTWPAGFPIAQPDHVLVGEGVTVLRGERCFFRSSDHLPVRARLAVP
jgi:endonuclease/exonuclease/phosphatase (EEP) superfamily protein YafD